jgi:hypothetical protein
LINATNPSNRSDGDSLYQYIGAQDDARRVITIYYANLHLPHLALSQGRLGAAGAVGAMARIAPDYGATSG